MCRTLCCFSGLDRGTYRALGRWLRAKSIPEKETAVNASTKSPSVEVTGIPILTAATTGGRSSILAALAIASIWVLVVAAVLFGVLAPLNNSFACAPAHQGELRAFNSSNLKCQFKKV
jgi:hypothetical protein